MAPAPRGTLCVPTPLPAALVKPQTGPYFADF